MSADNTLAAHRRELARKLPVYRLFDPLEQCDLADETVAALREQLGRLTELVLLNGLRTRPEALRAVDSFVRLPDQEARDVFATWLATVEAAGPSRKAMQLVLDSFGSWVSATRNGIRSSFLTALPELAPYIDELRGDGMERVIAVVNRLSGPESAAAFLACVPDYVVLAREWPEFLEKYEIFRPLEASTAEDVALDESNLTDEMSAALRAEAMRFAQQVISHGLKKPRGLLTTVDSLLELGKEEAREGFAAWASALAAAETSRPGMQLVLDCFGEWFASTNTEVRGAFLEALPNLGPWIHGLGHDGMERVIEALNGVGEPGAAHKLLQCVGEYGLAAAQSVPGVCTIAEAVLEHNRPAYLDRLRVAISPEAVRKERDAEKLIPLLADLTELTVTLGTDHFFKTLDLIFSLAERSCSSAYVTARSLKKHFRKMDAEVALAYLVDFAELVRTNGIRAVGFGCRLPKLYRKHGRDRTHAFVDAAASVAEAYGVTAGQWFYETRTAPARELLSRTRD